MIVQCLETTVTASLSLSHDSLSAENAVCKLEKQACHTNSKFPHGSEYGC